MRLVTDGTGLPLAVKVSAGYTRAMRTSRSLRHCVSDIGHPPGVNALAELADMPKALEITMDRLNAGLAVAQQVADYTEPVSALLIARRPLTCRDRPRNYWTWLLELLEFNSKCPSRPLKLKRAKATCTAVLGEVRRIFAGLSGRKSFSALDLRPAALSVFHERCADCNL